MNSEFNRFQQFFLLLMLQEGKLIGGFGNDRAGNGLPDVIGVLHVQLQKHVCEIP